MAGAGGNTFNSRNRAPSGLTSDRIQADMKRFERAGGIIEKLGNTPALGRRGKTGAPGAVKAAVDEGGQPGR